MIKLILITGAVLTSATAGTLSIAPVKAPQSVSVAAGPVALTHDARGTNLEYTAKAEIAVTVKSASGRTIQITF